MEICLEFMWKNNTTEYEALLQGSRKVIDIQVKHLKVYGDSNILVKHVCNTIHYTRITYNDTSMKYGGW